MLDGALTVICDMEEKWVKDQLTFNLTGKTKD
jgi:hypothetical protein